MKRRLGFQSLETRRLLIGELLNNLVPVGATPVVVEEHYFFVSSSGDHGNELFSAQMTSEGPRVRVHDLAPGPDSSQPADLHRVGDRLVFLTCIGQGEVQLWVTDGSETEGGEHGFRRLETFGSIDGSHPEISILGVTDSSVVIRDRRGRTSDGAAINQALVIPINDGETFALGEPRADWHFETYVAGNIVVHVDEYSQSGISLLASDGTLAGTQTILDVVQLDHANVVPVGNGIGIIGRDSAFEYAFYVRSRNGVLDASLIHAGNTFEQELQFVELKDGILVRDMNGVALPVFLNNDGAMTTVGEVGQWNPNGISRSADHVFDFRGGFIIANSEPDASGLILFESQAGSSTFERRDDLPLLSIGGSVTSVEDWLIYPTDLDGSNTVIAVHFGSGARVDLGPTKGEIGTIGGYLHQVALGEAGERFRILRLNEVLSEPEVILDLPHAGQPTSEGVVQRVFEDDNESLFAEVRYDSHVDLVRVESGTGEMQIVSRHEVVVSDRFYNLATNFPRELHHVREGLYFYARNAFRGTNLRNGSGVFSLNGFDLPLEGYSEIGVSDGAIYAANLVDGGVVRVDAESLAVERFDLPVSAFAVTRQGAILMSEQKALRLDDAASDFAVVIEDFVENPLPAVPTSIPFDRPRVLHYSESLNGFVLFDGTAEGSGFISTDSFRGRWSRDTFRYGFIWYSGVNPSPGAHAEVERPGHTELQHFYYGEDAFVAPQRFPGGWAFRGQTKNHVWLDGDAEPVEVNGYLAHESTTESWAAFTVRTEQGSEIVRDMEVLVPNGTMRSLTQLLNLSPEPRHSFRIVAEIEGDLVFIHRDATGSNQTVYRWDGVSDQPIEIPSLSEYFSTFAISNIDVFIDGDNWVVQRQNRFEILPMERRAIETSEQLTRVALDAETLRLESTDGTVSMVSYSSGQEVTLAANETVGIVEVEILDPRFISASGIKLDFPNASAVNLIVNGQIDRAEVEAYPDMFRFFANGRDIEVVTSRLNVAAPSQHWVIALPELTTDVNVARRDSTFEIDLLFEDALQRLTVENTSLEIIARSRVGRVGVDPDSTGTGELAILRTSPTTEFSLPNSMERLTTQTTGFGRRLVTGSIGDLAIRADLTFRPDHNFLNPFDVNGDDAVSPLDALAIINRLSDRQLLEDDSMRGDVNGDGRWSPLDALQVINYLTRTPQAEGEGIVDSFSQFNSSHRAETEVVESEVAEEEFRLDFLPERPRWSSFADQHFLAVDAVLRRESMGWDDEEASDELAFGLLFGLDTVD